VNRREGAARQRPPGAWHSPIDLTTLTLNALWVAGLAVLLAAVSYHRWLAGQTSRSLRAVLSERSWTIPSCTGMVLTSIGFGYGLGTEWWERAIWSAIAVIFGYRLVAACRSERNAK